jgi:hypothetical protein
VFNATSPYARYIQSRKLPPHPPHHHLSSRSILILSAYLPIGFLSSHFPSHIPTNNVRICLPCMPHAPTHLIHLHLTIITMLASSTSHKSHHMMQLSTFSSYFLSLKNKHFISTSYLTLSIISTASNELQILTDTVLYDTKKTILVSIHPSIHPMALHPITNPWTTIFSASKLF